MSQESLYSYNFNSNECIEFRLITTKDSIEELTQLLNKSYKILADMGLKYVAATQDDSVTLNRVRNAYKCYIGIYQNRIVSTISLYSPEPSDKSSWYSKEFVAKIGQFAVDTELQKYGIGSRMMDIVEEEARKINNVREIALDTAETAYHLIDFYRKREYRYIETIEWGATNYKSVVLSKELYSY
ncbi:GNAT family N-acetyltransferase [uncultured Tissierella sp.]|uniref:GNAT family N-acetyltransferase n=1 Tax=uncultured Tissierella sp. TaxID=448160 RepID=UPI002804E52C|nr:GNAT family N-acetyltransferase [uncultured Tissierella sp.]MDU5083485.1 GNAT family N-acetyltransferase [Bacillota bacterium]